MAKKTYAVNDAVDVLDLKAGNDSGGGGGVEMCLTPHRTQCILIYIFDSENFLSKNNGKSDFNICYKVFMLRLASSLLLTNITDSFNIVMI
ncbi:hypothetical protein DERP_008111 [Dermatophagoides pteronyssinus]|uniref:Uncharacterized protein n=1 Tax=Dermatophagoides pteronyssinus TaxID=6956 RepID=A0ABQ8JJS2_DERPT|nr:hypothetical protein DERP_008111 [Dermatophagoides pteronyssinus]